MRILITGGTVFVSRFAARYFVSKGAEVYVLNRGNHPQEAGVHWLAGDRAALGNLLKGLHFHAVLDICAYTGEDIHNLLAGLESFDDYILVSSSAVYPETLPQPYREEQPGGPNAIWGAYGTHKLAAEQALLACCPHACILRPPYLYGPMQNLYREPFVFECAEMGRPFYIPGDGSMQLQFFHVEDLCRVMEQVLKLHPSSPIFNVGNRETVDINTFVALCYRAAGVPLKKVYVTAPWAQRDYFSFHSYAYRLDVTKQQALLSVEKDLYQGLVESYAWYKEHRDEVKRKPLLDFIDSRLGTVR